MNTSQASLETTSSEENDHSEYAMQLASSSVLPMALKAAIDLGVLEIIAGAGPDARLSPSQIASQLPTSNLDSIFMLDRILRLLASYSILTCSVLDQPDNQGRNHVHRLYGLAPVSKYFLPSEESGSLAPIFQVIQDKTMINMWYHTKDAIMEGGLPFNRAYGVNASEFISKDSRYLQLFRKSMSDYNAFFMKKILETYRGFQGLGSLVDVGGGDGSILNMIVVKYPRIKGINFDLASVIEKSPPYPGIEHVAGDMYLTIPEGDAIFMKWMLHSLDNEHCVKILKNCYLALPKEGKLIIVDMVVRKAPDSSSLAVRSKLQFDLYMMNMNPGGKERTEEEFEFLAKAAGFSSIRVACSAFNFSPLEFYM